MDRTILCTCTQDAAVGQTTHGVQPYCRSTGSPGRVVGAGGLGERGLPTEQWNRTGWISALQCFSASVATETGYSTRLAVTRNEAARTAARESA